MALEFLRDHLLRYLNAETGLRHFRRIALLDSFRHRQPPPAASSPLSERLIEASRSALPDLTTRLQSHDDGLTEGEAEDKLERFGLNEVQQEKPMPWWLHLWHCYSNPFNLLLTLLAAVSYFEDDVSGMIVIAAMVLLSTALRFAQESRSNRAADRLKEMVSTKATVLRRDPSQNAAPEASRYFGIELHVRPARRLEVPIRLLVPGDQVVLAAGDMIPADVRVLAAKDLFVSQAALTGEALPAEKYPTPARCQRQQSARARQYLLHGYQRGERIGYRDRGCDRWRHLFRCAGIACHSSRPCANGVPGRRQQGDLAVDPLHGGHDATGISAQRLPQTRLGRSIPVRHRSRSRPDARNAAHDRHPRRSPRVR